MEPPTYLAKKHKHPRDKRIVFDEGPHVYYIDGDDSFTSCTTWNHSHFPHFNADKIIKNMMRSKKWPHSTYFGMTPDAIKALWSENGRLASEAGTKMHYDIECFYNDEEVEVEEDCIEWQYFENFEKEVGQHLKPYRTEWTIFDEEMKIAGSIDMIYEKPNGHLLIYDWKRCKEIKKSNYFESANRECISHLPNSNYWHYALQLNTYKAILERKYKKKVDGLFLVCLHPNNFNKNYQRIEVPHLKTEMDNLIKERIAEIKLQQSLVCDTCYTDKNVKQYNKNSYGERELCGNCLKM